MRTIGESSCGYFLTEIGKVQELVYELRVEQVMNRDVISISPNCSMRELEELLRIKRISGVPVVENGTMIGVISLEDLIRALGEGAGLAPVRERMVSNIQVVRPEEPVVSAVQLFARYGYGRFPVVNPHGELVGILTKGDIIRGLLRQLGRSGSVRKSSAITAATCSRGSNPTTRCFVCAIPWRPRISPTAARLPARSSGRWSGWGPTLGPFGGWPWPPTRPR